MGFVRDCRLPVNGVGLYPVVIAGRYPQVRNWGVSPHGPQKTIDWISLGDALVCGFSLFGAVKDKNPHSNDHMAQWKPQVEGH